VADPTAPAPSENLRPLPNPAPEPPTPILETKPVTTHHGIALGGSVVWKDIREWAAFVTSLVALGVSFAGFINSRASSNLAQIQFNSDRAIVLVGEKMKDEKPQGLMFKFHPLSSSQHLSKLQITVPSTFAKGSWLATPPDQVISLASIGYKVGDFYLKSVGRQKGYANVVRAEIPVVFDAFYSVAGDSMQRRGLYSLEALVVIGENDTELPSVDFEDFAFIQPLALDMDPQKIADEAWSMRKQPDRH
jgi:hypothetical protein